MMKFKQEMIEDYYCIIHFDELYFLGSKEIENCIKIIKYFTKGDKYFFGFYREDGNFDDYSETIEYRLKIPKYFKSNGSYVDLTLDKFKGNKYFDRRISAVGRLTVNEDTYEMIPRVCNYYLETMFFEPLKGWEEFEFEYKSNPMQSAIDFIKREYADLIFCHADSGTFFITFNTRKFNVEKVIAEVERIIC